MDAKREEAIRRLKRLMTEVKKDKTTGFHEPMHEPQESSDTRSVKPRKFSCNVHSREGIGSLDSLYVFLIT